MTESAVTEAILKNPHYAGAIDSVSFITDWIDVGFGMVITMVAFLIILVAMLKNVLAGAYCAFPKFWDKVHEAHEQKKDEGWLKGAMGFFGNKEFMNVNGASVQGFIWRILPDIKAITDFENTDAASMSPKNYFLKAIPAMIVCICIGAFIYNGFYRDTAAKVVDFGSEIMQRTILEADPIAMYDHFVGTSGRPAFTFDTAVDDRGKMINELETELYSAFISEFNDIKSTAGKRALADSCESIAIRYVDEVAAVDTAFITNAYKSRWAFKWSMSSMDTSSAGGWDNTHTNYVMVWCFDVNEVSLDTAVTSDQAKFMRVALQLTKQGGMNSNGQNIGDVILVASGSLSQEGGGTGSLLDGLLTTPPTNGGSYYQFPRSSIKGGITATIYCQSGDGNAYTATTTVEYRASAEGGKIVQSGPITTQSGVAFSISDAKYLQLNTPIEFRATQANANKTLTHSLKYIALGAGQVGDCNISSGQIGSYGNQMAPIGFSNSGSGQVFGFPTDTTGGNSGGNNGENTDSPPAGSNP